MYNVFLRGRGRVIAANLLYGSIAVLSERVAERLRRGEVDELPRGVVEELAENGFLVREDVDETAIYRYLLDRTRYGKKWMGVVYTVTLNCNLACTYCVQHGFSRRRDMDMETARAAVEWTLREMENNGIPALFAMYYGGEPLLNPRAVETIHSSLKERLKGRGTYISLLITNGVLVKDNLELARDMDYVQLTLDGPREVHDARRIRPGGEGTFDEVVEAMLSLVDYTRVLIRINVDRTNADRIPELIDYLDELGVRDKLEAVGVAPVITPYDRSYGGGSLLTPGEAAEKIVELTLYILDKGFKTELHDLGYGPCMIVSDRDYVVNYDGKLHKCAGLLDTELTVVGDVWRGVDPARHASLMNTLAWDTCPDTCRFKPICGGGCRFLRYVNHGRLDKPVCTAAYNAVVLPRASALHASRKLPGLAVSVFREVWPH